MVEKNICQKCILPQEFPGITFSAEGVCNYCEEYQKEAGQEDLGSYEKQFLEFCASHKTNSEYDCLLAYSGGKDSTYTLYLLREKYGLNVLAYTFDNGFISDAAKVNIKTVTENLDADSIIFSPRIELLKAMFKNAALNDNVYSQAALMRASAICTTCINFIRYNSLKLAVEKRIPLLIFGWAPGQVDARSIILKPQPAFMKKSQDVFVNANKNYLEKYQDIYFLTAEQYSDGHGMPHFVNPLLFNEYDLGKIKAVIESLGWRNPRDTDSNSTNCLLNTFGNYMHQKKHGYNPYVQEISELIRTGIITREEGLERLEKSLDQNIIDECVRKLDIDRGSLGG